MSTIVVDQAASTTTVRILLVEDSPDHQALASRALRLAGYEVEVAGSGEEAIARLEDPEAPDIHLALVDQGLPRMSGTQVLERIVSLPGGPGAIMVTASAANELVLAAMRNGAVDFVSKEAGYLDVLPAVVERAHRQWDLRQRTRELQRVALLVHRSSNLQETVDEVVQGICRLLRAPDAVLMVRDVGASQWRTASSAGSDHRAFLHAVDWVSGALGGLAQRDGVLAVQLPTEPDEPEGVLLVHRDTARPFVTEEEDLAETFAAFAAAGLRQSRRAEIEGGLITELQQTIRARRDFVASVSHELRTPLTSIGGYAETILTHRDRIDDETLYDLVGRVRRHAGDLERLIDQLLDVAKLERGNHFDAVIGDHDIGPVIRDAVQEVMHLLGDRTVDLIGLDDLPAALVDPDFVTRIMTNLLTNAIKYSAPGSPISVTAEVLGPQVEVRVRDHGIGINPNETVLAFQPFWRAGHAVAQAVRGTGVGLSLVHEYVQTLRGEVGCHASADGDGSVFWFRLPIAGEA